MFCYNTIPSFTLHFDWISPHTWFGNVIHWSPQKCWFTESSSSPLLSSAKSFQCWELVKYTVFQTSNFLPLENSSFIIASENCELFSSKRQALSHLNNQLVHLQFKHSPGTLPWGSFWFRTPCQIRAMPTDLAKDGRDLLLLPDAETKNIFPVVLILGE